MPLSILGTQGSNDNTQTLSKHSPHSDVKLGWPGSGPWTPEQHRCQPETTMVAQAGPLTQSRHELDGLVCSLPPLPPPQLLSEPRLLPPPSRRLRVSLCGKSKKNARGPWDSTKGCFCFFCKLPCLPGEKKQAG